MLLHGWLDVQKLDPQLASVLVRSALVDHVVAHLQVLAAAVGLLLRHDYFPVLRGQERDLR